MLIARGRASFEINCTTGTQDVDVHLVFLCGIQDLVKIAIDNETTVNDSVRFTYRDNPHFTSVTPQFTIPG